MCPLLYLCSLLCLVLSKTSVDGGQEECFALALPGCFALALLSRVLSFLLSRGESPPPFLPVVTLPCLLKFSVSLDFRVAATVLSFISPCRQARLSLSSLRLCRVLLSAVSSSALVLLLFLNARLCRSPQSVMSPGFDYSSFVCLVPDFPLSFLLFVLAAN